MGLDFWRLSVFVAHARARASVLWNKEVIFGFWENQSRRLPRIWTKLPRRFLKIAEVIWSIKLENSRKLPHVEPKLPRRFLKIHFWWKNYLFWFLKITFFIFEILSKNYLFYFWAVIRYIHQTAPKIAEVIF